MKNLSFVCTTILYFLNSIEGMAQEDNYPIKNKIESYVTINGLLGNPVQEFWENYTNQALPGFNVDFVCTPSQKASFFEPGAQIEFFSAANSTDTWDDIEVKSKSFFLRFNAISRFRLLKTSDISPYIEVGYGLNMALSSTSYEIGDNASILEELLLGQEDEVEKVAIKEFEDYSHNLHVGLGVFLYGWINLQVKYNYCPTIRYIQKDGFKITNSSIDYLTSESKIQMLVVSLGINFERAFKK